MFGMDGAGGATVFLLVAWLVFTVCLAIAPLIIWRNTNRTNRLLARLLFLQGEKIKEIERSFKGVSTRDFLSGTAPKGMTSYALPKSGQRQPTEQDARQEEMLHLLRKIAEKRERPAREGERSEVIELKEVAMTTKNKN